MNAGGCVNLRGRQGASTIRQMSEIRSDHLITFPWDGVLPAEGMVVLRDVDVVGVGAGRRQQINEIQKQRSIILQTHEAQIPENVRAIYDQELLNSLQWIRPVKTVTGPPLDLFAEHKQTFSKIFPLTEKYLGLMAGRVRDSYLDEMEWSSWLLQDHWRYFVGFLRQRFAQSRELSDLAHWEWVQAWLEVQPFDISPPEEPGILSSNPSLQIVILNEDNKALSKPKGIYAFVYTPSLGRVTERALDPAEALLIDLLQEDRKYNTEQLIDMALLSEELSTQLTSVEWQNKLDSLKAAAILL